MGAQEDVELCVRSYEDWAAGGPKLASASWSEDYSVPPALSAEPGPCPCVGRDAVVAHLLGVAADTGSIAVEVAEAVPAGPGQVLLTIHTRIEEPDARRAVTGESSHLLSVSGGEITGVRVFLDPDEARGRRNRLRLSPCARRRGRASGARREAASGRA